MFNFRFGRPTTSMGCDPGGAELVISLSVCDSMMLKTKMIGDIVMFKKLRLER